MKWNKDYLKFMTNAIGEKSIINLYFLVEKFATQDIQNARLARFSNFAQRVPFKLNLKIRL